MKNNELTSPRGWYYNNEDMVNSLGFHMSMGDGDNIGLSHNDLNNEIDIYWENETDDNHWIVSTLYDSEKPLYFEVETEEDFISVLKHVLENMTMFNSIEDEEE